MSRAIVVEDLGKRLRRYHPERPRTLKDAFLNGFQRIKPVKRFWALRQVSFSVSSGRMVGIIGANGAGKSTLLRLIGGIGKPDTGRVAVHGRIAALLDLGAGFHGDLTGRQNVGLSGVVAGLTRREVADRFDSIVAFAGLRRFIDSPVRTYSSGMKMRLAFAVAVHVEPQVLLIDEVLAVGDHSFQKKCRERILRFKSDGCAIVLVSHDTTLVRKICDEVLWLHAGRLIAHGPADPVVGRYLDLADRQSRLR